MARQLAVAAAFCLIGALVYIHWSEGPVLVQQVTLGTHALYLLGLCFIVWLGPLRRSQRFVLGIAWTAVIAILGTYLDSKVISAFATLHIIYIAMAFVGFALEGSLFLYAVGQLIEL